MSWSSKMVAREMEQATARKERAGKTLSHRPFLLGGVMVQSWQRMSDKDGSTDIVVRKIKTVKAYVGGGNEFIASVPEVEPGERVILQPSGEVFILKSC